MVKDIIENIPVFDTVIPSITGFTKTDNKLININNDNKIKTEEFDDLMKEVKAWIRRNYSIEEETIGSEIAQTRQHTWTNQITGYFNQPQVQYRPPTEQQ
jgi:hypothetical protein